VTEGGTEGPSTSGSGPDTAEPCGLASSVPRCLRWTQRVPLYGWSCEQTEALVLRIWRARRCLEAASRADTLQAFLFYYFNPQVRRGRRGALRNPAVASRSLPGCCSWKGQGRGTRPGCRWARGAAGHVALALSPPPRLRTFHGGTPSHVAPQGLPTPDSVRLTYSLYHAASVHAKASPLVRTFWLVLTGQVAEAAATDQRVMLSGLTALLHALPAAGPSPAGEDGPRLRVDDVASALERLFPGRPAFRLNKLREALVSQCPGETVARDSLADSLALWTLSGPPSSSAPSTARDARWKPLPAAAVAQPDGGLPPGPSLPPLLGALLGQHIDELQGLGLEVAGALADVPPPGPEEPEPSLGGSGPVGAAPAVLERLGTLLGPGRAMSALLAALGFLPGGADAHGGEDEAGSGDVVLPGGLVLDLTDLAQGLLSRVLLKPPGSYDVSGALAWATQAAAEAPT
jgi:hypothetical protein